MPMTAIICAAAPTGGLHEHLARAGSGSMHGKDKPAANGLLSQVRPLMLVETAWSAATQSTAAGCLHGLLQKPRMRRFCLLVQVGFSIVLHSLPCGPSVESQLTSMLCMRAMCKADLAHWGAGLDVGNAVLWHRARRMSSVEHPQSHRSREVQRCCAHALLMYAGHAQAAVHGRPGKRRYGAGRYGANALSRHRARQALQQPAPLQVHICA